MKNYKSLLVASVILFLITGCKEISVTPEEVNIGCDGGTFEVTVSSNKSWSVVSNQPWAIPNVSTGHDNDNFYITVHENVNMRGDQAIVTVTNTIGDNEMIVINRAGTGIPEVRALCNVFYKSEKTKLSIKSDDSWNVSVDRDWVTISSSTGIGDANLTLSVKNTEEDEPDNATVTVRTETGMQKTVQIKRRGVRIAGSVTDVCGNQYKVVRIGSMLWTASNMKCDKYDTESEAYKSGLKTIPAKAIDDSRETFTACRYPGAENRENWYSSASWVTDKEINRFGYFYNWAAAVGVGDGKKEYSFKSNRQGICPNGWHLPASFEWGALLGYINGKLGENPDMYLKSMTGWYRFNDEEGSDAENDYGFGAVPTGVFYGTSTNFIRKVGYTACFWTSTPKNVYEACYHRIDGDDRLMSYKSNGMSVRCVKNNR